MILGRHQFPRCLDRPEVRGVFVGGCVKRGEGSRFRAKAHSHIGSGHLYSGWICFLSWRRLVDQPLVLHELAHILTGGGHDDAWRAKVLEIGGTLDPVAERTGNGSLLKSYHKNKKT